MKKKHLRLCLGLLLAFPAVLLLAFLAIRVRDAREKQADESIRRRLEEALRGRGPHWEDVTVRRGGRIMFETSLGMSASRVRGPYRYRFGANAKYGPDIIWVSVRHQDERDGPMAHGLASFQFMGGNIRPGQARYPALPPTDKQRPLTEAEKAALEEPVPALAREFYEAVLEANR